MRAVVRCRRGAVSSSAVPCHALPEDFASPRESCLASGRCRAAEPCHPVRVGCFRWPGGSDRPRR
eukprot:8932149-Pyramimonas_sp.AAC.1